MLSASTAMKDAWRFLLLAALSSSFAGGFWWAGSHSPQTQLVCVLWAAALGLGLLIWILNDPSFSKLRWLPLCGLALLLRLLALQATPLLEDDHFRYLWDGFQTASTGNPYRFAPSHFFGNAASESAWGAILDGINNPDIPTIYGPVLQALFALAYGLVPASVGAVQALLLTVDLLVLWALRRAGTAMPWLLLYAVHPLVLKESIASAHPDNLLGLWLLLSCLAWRKERALATGILLGLAVATKISAVVVIPFLVLMPLTSGRATSWRAQAHWAGLAAFGMVATVLLCYLPFVLSGGTDWHALAVFGQAWRFNPLLFRLVESLLPGSTSRIAAGAMLLLALCWLWWRWLGDRKTPDGAIPPIDTTLFMLLMLSPVVNPWYWLWALPVAVYRRNLVLVLFACVSELSYLNSTVLAQTGWGSMPASFSVPWGITVLQLAALLALWLVSRARSQPRISA